MFNVIIISLDNFVCVLLYVIEWMYRLLSLNPEYNHIDNHNHNHIGNFQYKSNVMRIVIHIAMQL